MLSKQLWLGSLACGLALVISAPAVAGSGTFTADGAVDVVAAAKKGHKAVLVESDVSASDAYGVIEYTPKRTKKNALELDELTNLSVTYAVVAGGTGGGSPRFSIALDTNLDGTADGNLFVYLGDPPNFTSGTTELIATGNLLADDDLRFDATQLGGDFYLTYDEVLDLVGDAEVLSVDFVVDAGWAFTDGIQTVLVTQLQVNHDKLNTKKLDD